MGSESKVKGCWALMMVFVITSIAYGQGLQRIEGLSPEIEELMHSIRAKQAQGAAVPEEDFEKAISHLEEKLEESPNESALVMGTANLYYSYGIQMASEDRKAANEPIMKGVKLVRAYVDAKDDELTRRERNFVGLAAYNEACCYAVDGETDKAISSLKEAMELGYDSVAQIRADTDFDSIRDDARFKELLGRSRPSFDDDDDDDDDGHDKEHDSGDDDHGDEDND